MNYSENIYYKHQPSELASANGNYRGKCRGKSSFPWQQIGEEKFLQLFYFFCRHKINFQITCHSGKENVVNGQPNKPNKLFITLRILKLLKTFKNFLKLLKTSENF